MIRFTPQELKLIERLRKQERRWPRMRWMFLVVAAFLLAEYGFFAVVVIHMLDTGKLTTDPTLVLVVLAFFWPKCLLAFCFAAWLIVVATRDWHGNVERMLLLRMLDDRQKETTGDAHAP
jgi:hypothetical protein